MKLEAVLDEQVLPLSRVMNLAVGDSIVLGTRPGSAVQLRCGSVPLFEAAVGRRQNQVAVRIEAETRRMATDAVAGPA